MKIYALILSFFLWINVVKAQTTRRPDVCPACIQDTTGGYTSIADTVKINPICNYERLRASYLTGIRQKRDTIAFFPHNLDALYNDSHYSRGHCIPFDDLAYSPKTAKASMNIRRNLAPQPQNENIGTKLACEDTTRTLAAEYGSVMVWGGTFGNYGNIKGINIPESYWTVIVTLGKDYYYWMPTHGDKVGYANLKDCHITYPDLVAKLGFEPQKVLPHQ